MFYYGFYFTINNITKFDTIPVLLQYFKFSKYCLKLKLHMQKLLESGDTRGKMDCL